MAEPATRYDAFISYAHEDGGIARAVQAELEVFARPWYRQRVLRVFLDVIDLSAGPGLRPEIERALESSDWFILVASPRSAPRPWVRLEVAWWLEHRGPDRMLVAWLDGTIRWDEAAGDFDWSVTDALPRELERAFPVDPRLANLRRFGRDVGGDTSDEARPVLGPAVADLAAPIRRIPKERLTSVHDRRARTFTLVVTAVVVTVLVLAGLAWYQGSVARDEAARALSRGLAARANAATSERPELRMLLAAAANEISDTPESRAAMLRASLGASAVALSLPGHAGGVADMDLSSDSSTMATVDGAGQVRVWRLDDGRLLLGPLAIRADLARVDRAGRVIVVDVDGGAHWYDIASGRRLAQVRLDQPDPVARTCDSVGCGRVIATVSSAGQVAVGYLDGAVRFLAPDGRRREERNERPITGLVYSPGGDLVVADTHGIRVWYRSSPAGRSDYVDTFGRYPGLLPGMAGFGLSMRFCYVGFDDAANPSQLRCFNPQWKLVDAIDASGGGVTAPGAFMSAVTVVPEGFNRVPTPLVASSAVVGGEVVPALFRLDESDSFVPDPYALHTDGQVSRVVAGANGMYAVGGDGPAVTVYRPGATAGNEVVPHSFERHEHTVHFPEWLPVLPKGWKSVGSSADESMLVARYPAGVAERGADLSGTPMVVRVFRRDGSQIGPDITDVPDARGVSFDATASHLLIGTSGGSVIRYAIDDRAVVSDTHAATASVDGLGLSPDGAWLLMQTPNELTVVEPETMERVVTLVVAGDEEATRNSQALYRLTSLTYLGASWEPDGTVYFGWSDMVDPPPYVAGTAPFAQREFPAPQQLPGTLSGDHTRAIVRVALAPAQLRTRICQVANRNLTPTEWATAVGAVSYRRVCLDLPEEPAGLSATPLHRPTSVPQPR